jgi:hypothetical protein
VMICFHRDNRYRPRIGRLWQIGNAQTVVSGQLTILSGASSLK